MLTICYRLETSYISILGLTTYIDCKKNSTKRSEAPEKSRPIETNLAGKTTSTIFDMTSFSTASAIFDEDMTKSHILQGISTTGVYYCKFYLRFSRFLPTFYVVLSKLRPLDNQCIAIKQNEWHGFYPIHLNFGWILGDSTTGVLLPHFFNCRVFCYNC